MVGSGEVSESGLKLICWVAAAALAGATLAIPQAVDPWEMPSLVLDREATSDAIRFDQSLAADAPESPEAQTVRSLFLAHGRAEANRPYPLREYDRRQAAIHHAIQALLAKGGPSALAAMRARAVEDFVQVFYDVTPEERSAEDLAILGGFSEIVGRYGLVRGNTVIAPELTVRTLYKARWNAIHRQPFTDGFSSAAVYRWIFGDRATSLLGLAGSAWMGATPRQARGSPARIRRCRRRARRGGSGVVRPARREARPGCSLTTNAIQ